MDGKNWLRNTPPSLRGSFKDYAQELLSNARDYAKEYPVRALGWSAFALIVISGGWNAGPAGTLSGVLIASGARLLFTRHSIKQRIKAGVSAVLSVGCTAGIAAYQYSINAPVKAVLAKQAVNKALMGKGPTSASGLEPRNVLYSWPWQNRRLPLTESATVLRRSGISADGKQDITIKSFLGTSVYETQYLPPTPPSQTTTFVFREVLTFTP